ncbi:MAG: molybdopterin-dependent oxidoreductase [Deltaproteobacteria bacterium]|nr:molybdopterin-dependent oxidoreductase [Deltaproteobacteria bacterium]
MKLNRRNFLSLGVGVVAGTTLSPLPWKLMDDVSIWSQNWPWTPLPPDGEVTFEKSVCTLCPGGCGITVRKIDDRAVKIEGIEDHPVNDGGVCLLGLSGLQLLYGPTRIKSPLKRVGERGEGKWQTISWNQALTEVAAKLGELRSNDRSHTVACISGSDQGTVPGLLNRFLAAYGSPNYIRTPSIHDSYEIALSLMHGGRSSAGFDVENTDFVLSFGSGIIDGWMSPVRMIKANSIWKNENSKVVQIEPRLSNTAAKSDTWVPIKPGTDAALALGLAHVIIKESLYDKDFVENYAFDFNAFKTIVLESFAPDDVAKITGVDKKTILSLAKQFAGASKPLAICGRGQGKTPGSIDEVAAVHALNALVGNINKPGGVWAVSQPDYIKWPEVQMDAVASSGMKRDRVDGAGSEKFSNANYLLNRWVGAVNSSDESPVQALFITDADPCYTLSDTFAVKKAFDKIPFVVSFSSNINETALNADLILPSHAFLERYEDVPLSAGLTKSVIALSKPVVKPQFNTKHVGDAIIEIAKKLGGSIEEAFPWDDYETCLKATLGDKWDALVENGYGADPDFGVPAWEGAFATASMKFEFLGVARVRSGEKDVQAKHLFTPVMIEGNEKSYPITLMPYDSLRLANGSIGDPPFAIKTVEDTVLKHKDVFIEMNPETAEAYDISEGDYAVLNTPKGKARVKIHLFDGIMPGLVAMPTGLGHTGPDEYLAGKGINFNELIGPVEDADFGLDAVWGIRANLTKA